MTDILPEADPLSAAAKAYADGVAQLRSELDQVKAELEMNYRLTNKLEAENEVLRKTLDLAEDKRDRYLQWACELVTQLNTIGGVIDTALTHAREMTKTDRRPTVEVERQIAEATSNIQGLSSLSIKSEVVGASAPGPAPG